MQEGLSTASVAGVDKNGQAGMARPLPPRVQPFPVAMFVSE